MSNHLPPEGLSDESREGLERLWECCVVASGARVKKYVPAEHEERQRRFAVEFREATPVIVQALRESEVIADLIEFVLNMSQGLDLSGHDLSGIDFRQADLRKLTFGDNIADARTWFGNTAHVPSADVPMMRLILKQRERVAMHYATTGERMWDRPD